jgi:WD40 repeat protein
MADFKRSLAVVIGINEYQDYPKLQTARYDAERLAEILVIEHKYDYVILVTDETYKEYRKEQELSVKNKYQPTLDGLRNLLDKRLPAEINPTKDDRLLFYFAGHGIPDDSDEGPKGYLVPLDADSKKRDSLLPMQELYKRLAALNCRHFLIILDCCFAGRFSWSSTRKGRTFPKVIHKEHYDRFINSPAWQAITSASHDQEAFDILGDDNRGTVEGTNHSPFAEGLFKALRGEADVILAGKNGQPARDGVITATELYLYLRNHVEIGSKERQTPGLWSLPKHDRGEYIFLVPGAELKLKPAPPVNEKNNPYRGLESFDEEHSRLFFGREELIQQLSERISVPKQPLTVVLGVSGSGKSSLVKAGLIPCLRKLSQSEVFEVNLVSAYILTSVIVQACPLVSPKFLPINYVHQWHILNPIRPGESPFTALAKTILDLADVTGSNQPDILNFLKVSTHLDNLTFITEILKQKVENLDEQVAESSHNNGEESSETLHLKKELEQFISMAKGWNQSTQKAKQLLIVKHFEELYALCRNQREQQQLQQAASDCLNPLSQRLQSDPNQLIDIVTAWSQKNPGVRLLLTIDQFEELITLSQSKQKDKQNNQQQQRKKFSNQPTQEVQQENKQEEWQQFLNLLEKTLSANLEQLRIIVTLRSDFEPRFLNSDALKLYWTQARFPLRAMRSDELRQAIERPASEIALYFEPPNLVDKLIDEVGQMPGALPLLSFTLSEQYKKLAEKWRIQETSDRALRLDADFDKEGGVAGSLTRRANQEYDGFPDDAHRATLRRVMLRMVTFEGGELARRRVPLSELVYADAVENERVKLVLEQFDRARLIVSGQETGEPYVEPAHDFLVRSWDKLQKWQQEEQEDLLLQRRLTPVAIEWKSKEQSSSLLGKTEPVLDWCDKRIDSVEDWLKNKIKKNDQQSQREKKRQFLWNGNPYLDVLRKKLKSVDYWFNQAEAEFVQQSVWQRRRNTNLLWGSAIAVMLGLSGLTIVALIGQRNAQIGQIRASRQSSEANLRSNQAFDALIESLRAGKTLKQPLLQLFKPDNQIQNQLQETLQKVVYQVKERNRLNWDQNVNDTRVSFIPDNSQQLVTVGGDGTLKLWNSQGQQVWTWRDKRKIDINISISRNAQTLATAGGEDGTISLWNLKGEQLHTWNGKQVWIRSISFSPDGQRLATGGSDGVSLWNLQGDELAKLETAPAWVWSVSFSPNGQLLAIGGSDGVYLWHLQNGQREKLKSDQNRVRSVSFSPNGQYLATAGDDGIVCLWNLQNRQLLKCWKGDRNGLWSVSFSPDGQLLATGGNSDTTRLWNLQGNLVAELKGKQTSIHSISFSLDGKRLATSGGGDTVELWDLQGQQLATIEEHQDPITDISFSPDSQQLATGGEKGTVRLLDLQGKELFKFSDHQGSIRNISFSPDGQQLTTAGDDNTVRSWNLQGQQLAEKSFPADANNYSRNLWFSPDKHWLAGITDKGEVHVRNLQGEQLIELPIEPYMKNHFQRIWPSRDNYFQRLWFSPDSRLFAGFRGNGLMSVRDLQDKSLKTSFLADPGGIPNVIFYSNNQRLAIAGGHGTVSLRDLQGNELFRFTAHQPGVGVQSLSLSPNGQQLATVGGDGTVRLWNFQGEQLAEFPANAWRVIFSPDNQKLATLARDGSAQVWQIETFEKLMERGCNWARDYLKNNPKVEENDRHLCDNIPPSTPSSQTTTANSSTPSIVQPSTQNAPSPTPASNNGQNNYRQAPSDRR